MAFSLWENMSKMGQSLQKLFWNVGFFSKDLLVKDGILINEAVGAKGRGFSDTMEITKFWVKEKCLNWSQQHRKRGYFIKKIPQQGIGDIYLKRKSYKITSQGTILSSPRLAKESANLLADLTSWREADT